LDFLPTPFAVELTWPHVKALGTNCQTAGLLAKWQRGKEWNFMSKRPSLADTMRNAVQSAPDLPIQPRFRARTYAEEKADSRRFHAATREGKKKVTGNLPPSIHKLLKALAVERETTTEALLAEAILDLLTKYNVKDRAA
jgi:hypothetical protein